MCLSVMLPVLRLLFGEAPADIIYGLAVHSPDVRPHSGDLDPLCTHGVRRVRCGSG